MSTFSAFGLKILNVVLIPYTVGIYLTCLGVRRLLRKESVIESGMYTILGLFFMLGAIWHLLFVADVDWYAA